MRNLNKAPLPVRAGARRPVRGEFFEERIAMMMVRAKGPIPEARSSPTKG
jgi:hypothetical protein